MHINSNLKRICLAMGLMFYALSAFADISVSQINADVDQAVATQTAEVSAPVVTSGVDLAEPVHNPVVVAKKPKKPLIPDVPKQKWQLVLLFQSTCPHCQHFDPVIADFAKRYGFHVYAFSLDGGALPDFPDPLLATQAVISKFAPYFPGGQIVRPAVFLVNTQNTQVIPVSVGEMPETDFASRVQQALSEAGGQS